MSLSLMKALSLAFLQNPIVASVTMKVIEEVTETTIEIDQNGF